MPVTQYGDIWQLGKHYLMCANSGDKDAIDRLMDGKLASLCFTSPPYGKQRNYKSQIDDWQELMKHVFAILPMTDEGQVLVNLGLIRKNGRLWRYWDGWIDWMEDCGWKLFDWYVWDQLSGLPGEFAGHLLPSHEFVFHLNKEKRKCNKTIKSKSAGKIRIAGKGMRNRDGEKSKFSKDEVTIQDKRVPDSIFRICRQGHAIGNGIDHPAVFPVAFPEFIIPIWTESGEIVFEPFSGSGTTIIASQKTGRICRAVEIVPEYVDVTLIRFSRIFPDIPIVHESGKTFDEMREGNA